jgi:Chitobiase/beta-hexosaminidase C-terminal domain/Putative collagen-binding domain of a collagenase
LKSYQATKPKQHPVGMSYLHLGSANDLLASPADWILLPGTDLNPPLAAGSKVVFSDMDPKLLGSSTSYPMVWKSFMRGLNPIYVESDLQNPSADENVRDSMGYALRYSQLVDLSSMSPNSESCSSGYCLINPGREYLVYLPAGGTVRVDLSATSNDFVASWFSPLTGQTTPGGTVSAASQVLLTSPINGDAVLYLQAISALSNQSDLTSLGLSSADTAPTAAAQGASAPNIANMVASTATVITPTITPNGGTFVNSVLVTLQTTTSGASIHYTTDGTNPTQSSTQYAAPFTLTTTSLVKAQAFKNGMTPSSQASVWFTKDASGVINIASMSTSNDETVSNVITLAWTDNSDNEDGFGIERKTGTNGTFSRITTVAANVTSYSDSGVVAGNTYCYRVNAFNAAGTSGYTNEACKTMTAPAPSFDFSLAHGGNKSVTQGQSVSNTITATLSTGSSQSVSFSTSGLPSGATASYSTSNSCSPTCSRTLNIATAASTPTGNHTITVTATGGGVTKTTNFTLTVNSTGGTPPSTYTLNPTPTTVQPGGTITISWTAPSGSASKDWIGLYATGVDNNSYEWWQYTNGSTSGSFTLSAPLITGTYEFRYLLNDGFISVKQSTTITVTGNPPTGTTYTLTATPGSVQSGGSITVSWTAPSGSASKDWIGLYATGVDNNSYVWWQYTNGASSGSFTVPAPSNSGTYEFRYLLNDGFNSVKQSNTITVTGSTS